jgi:hypothetical protein
MHFDYNYYHNYLIDSMHMVVCNYIDFDFEYNYMDDSEEIDYKMKKKNIVVEVVNEIEIVSTDDHYNDDCLSVAIDRYSLW